MTRFFLIFVLATILSACGGGGGGGDGTNSTGGSASNNVPRCSDTGTAYQTTEYYWMDAYDRTTQALARICASTAYANGATGSGVKIAIIDTGLSLNSNGTNIHREFGSSGASFPTDKVVLVDGADSVGQTANTDDDIPEDNDGHGTHVAATAGAIKDGVGMHGVAYNATLYPIKHIDPYGTFFNASAWAFYRAIDNSVDIINNSWEVPGGQVGVSCNSDSSCESWIQSREEDPSGQTYEYAKLSATFAGIINVWAAGNDGYANPSVLNGSCIYNSTWKELCVVVVAVSTDGRIASFSNRCGAAADVCVAAPGVDIYAASIGGSTSYENLAGTSMAAPLVSGGLALIKQKFSSLTNQQVIDRLLTTATDHGVYASSQIYGHGLINLGAATSNISSLQVLNMAPNLNLDDSKSTYSELSSHNMTASIAMNAAVNHSLRDKTMEVYDSFDRANFKVNISSFLNNDQLLNKHSINNHLYELSLAGGKLITKENKKGKLMFMVNTDSPKTLFTSTDKNYIFGNNISSNNFFNEAKQKLNLNSRDTDQRFFDNPYFYHSNNDLSFTYNVGDASAEVFSELEGRDIGISLNYQPGLNKRNKIQTYGDLELSLGIVLEDKKVLNSQSSGVFSLGENSSTTFVGVKYRKNLNDLNLFANLYYGSTDISQQKNSYINLDDSVLSNSYAIGLIKDNWLKKGQKIAVILDQPQKIIEGRGTLTVPLSSNRNREVTMEDINLNLVSSETQNNYSVYFEKSFNRDESFHLNLTHIDNPYHDGNRKSENNLSVIYKKYF